MRTTITTAAALSLAALAFGAAAPAATADSIGVNDPKDTFHGSDLRSVEVRNNDKAVRIITTHLNLVRDPDSGQGGRVFIDTDRSDKGPEFVLVGGYYRGTDYQLVHTEGFRTKQWGRPVTKGFYEMKVDYKRDHVSTRITRAALGHPGKVRVAVRVAGNRTDGTSRGLVDWLKERRSFTPWVARG